ncbi:hypothetical protein E1218_14875 [Kribbella turkmenica]|uniref:Uncharacterized protein n=1 Tax=Kribbella turkmenica TaxID=2530375 RepID=A0A4R4X5F1_9ACTN|nr:hypothetical protein [Kribbella turkmenica]TDD25459.1 hypothetical protein E1218_14875 [Kribbella turkmenica]
MSELRRGVGKDLCGRVHAVTGVECYLADTHYPAPHQSLDGDSWHDGLCSKCAGGGIIHGLPCDRCNTTGVEPVALIDPDSYQPG